MVALFCLVLQQFSFFNRSIFVNRILFIYLYLFTFLIFDFFMINYGITSPKFSPLQCLFNPLPLPAILILVAILWGATNPFIRKGSSGVEKIHARNALQKKIAEIAFLATRWSVIIYFVSIKSPTIHFILLI